MNSNSFAFAVLLATTMSAFAAPRMVISTPSLVPESKIDLVLDLPVVETSEIGKTVENTWLEIKPDLPGKLRWKAQNIAEFIPEKSPTIGTSYSFSIQKNRTHIDATGVPAGKFATLNSEDFRVLSATTHDRWSSDYVPSTADWTLYFNDNIDPATAATFISFVSSTNQRIPAHITQASAERVAREGRNFKPWAARWGNPPATQAAADTAVSHVLIAQPEQALPPGKGWKLVVNKGLPNTTATARTTDGNEYEIGEIKPFTISDISASVVADRPRTINISLSQHIAEPLPNDFLSSNLTIEPRPDNLKAVIDGNNLEITGNLSENAKYSVTIKPPLKSNGGLELAGTFHKDIEFKHLEPELALPSDNQAQFSNGQRTYRAQTVNLSQLHLRIKKLTGRDLVRTFQGFRSYTGSGPDGETIQPTAPLPWSLITGDTLVEKDISLDNPIDTSKEIVLSWDSLLPKDLRQATLFVELTGTSQPDALNPGSRKAQSIIQLTDIGLAWKFTQKEALVYAFSCNTGAPLPGVKIQIFGEDAASIEEKTTDASGLVTVSRPSGTRHLAATQGTDAYITAFDSTLGNVGMWHFPIRYSWSTPAESTRKAMLFTDRSLYRPGETVRLKGIVRMLHGNTIEASNHGPARIVIIDPTEKEILSQPVTISPNGSFDFTHTLAPSKTGTHMIRLEFTDELAKIPTEDSESSMDWDEREHIVESARFEMELHVEEFRRNAFEVNQSIIAPVIGANKINANLIAKYYQGQPVAAGNVKHYSRVNSRNPYPERFRDFLFGNHRSYDWAYWYHYFGYREDDSESAQHSSNLQGETQLTTNGSAAISIDLPPLEFPLPQEVEISSEVTDANNQTLTTRSSATVHPSSVYVGISRIDTLARAGQELPVRIAAVDTEDKPFNQPLKLTATLTREINNAVKTQTSNGATTTQNDVTEETVLTTEFTLDPAASAKDGQTLTITPTANGLHFLTVRGNDPEGRPFKTVSSFQVYGTNEYPWLYEDGMRVKLVAEKKSYKPGDTARVLVLSPIEGTALVTIEREKVLRSFQIQLKSDNPVVEIPLTDDDAPNAFVSVLIVKGAKESARQHKEPQLRLGYCELLVENQRDQLAVAIDTPAESYRPGENVTLSGIVTLADGKPAAGAEITLYAEDEGTLAVMGYETPNPMSFFYDPRNLDVIAGTSFDSFISEDPEMQDFHNKGFFIGGGGDMSKLADLMRKDFDPCATWAPVLVTDGNGKFTHTFKLPDTLTRYRVIAIAHHDTTRFGHAESAIVAKKDLMLEAKSPRFANQTDIIHPQVLVQNASRFAGTWKVELNAHAADGTPVCRALEGSAETVSLSPGGSATVSFPVLAENTGEAVFTWKATPVSMQVEPLTAELIRRLSDAVESRFQVEYPMPLIHQVKFVKLDSQGTVTDLRQALDESLLDGTGSIDLEFARSPLTDAAGSADFLLHYPYGCVEQTTSSLMPWCAVEELKDVIPSFAKIPEAKVKAALQAGADRLLSMQLPNGSFSYWPGSSESVDWATPYAGMGLMLAKGKGASVPDSAIEALTQNLIASLRGMAETKSASALETHTRTLLVLSLAEQAQPAYQNALIDRIAELTPAARAMLAASIATGNDEDLDKARQVMESKVPCKLKKDDWMPYAPDLAYDLIAWTTIAPNGPEAVKTLDRMLNERNPYGHWRTTWANGWSLIAMAMYAEHDETRGETVNFNLDTHSGNETIQLNNENPTAIRSLALGPNLKLNVTADPSAFVRCRIASKPPVAPIQPVAKNGLSIDRIYHLVKPDGTTEPLTEPKPGNLIRVSLRVTLPSDNTRYLVIEDPLPAVFETVNNDFDSQSNALGIATSENNWQISHSELRSDKAVFFLDHVWHKGTYTLTYLARCTLAGTATAPPAKVESMYDPENFALSASRVFSTK